MNGHTEMPTLTFGEGCDYDTIDSVLNGNKNTGPGYTKHGVSYGWGVRVWLKQGVIITALWGYTTCDFSSNGGDEETLLLAWSEKDGDYCKPIKIPTDDITRLEIL